MLAQHLMAVSRQTLTNRRLLSTESPLLEGDEEGEGGEQTAAPAAGGLPVGLTKEVLAALEAQDSTASLGAAGGPVKLAPAKVAAVPVPEVRKSMQSFSFSRRVELQVRLASSEGMDDSKHGVDLYSRHLWQTKLQ